MIAPSDLKLPFPSFRDGQLSLSTSCLSHPICVLEAATGVGKTGIYTTAGRILGDPILVSCASKSQQSQIANLNYYQLFGHSHYCEISPAGECWPRPCQYRYHVKQAQDFGDTVTNHHHLISLGIKNQLSLLPSNLVIDEAHTFHDIGCSILSTVFPTAWGGTLSEVLASAEAYEDGDDYKLSYAKSLAASISTIPEKDLIVCPSKDGVSVDVIWSTSFLKPILAYYKRIIISSATFSILDQSLLGLPRDTKRIEVPSPYARSNRPIFYKPVIKVTKRSSARDLDKLADAIISIASVYPQYRGIVHTYSYWLAEELLRRLPSRFQLIRSSPNIMGEVEASRSNAVFVTPIAIEGLDFKGDLARFQMFAKIPFPNKYTDILMARRCQRRGYEENYIIRTLRQMWGRICRDNDDWGLTYILDESWERFYQDNEQRFPEDFRLCLE